jgi:hypothetical protein
MTPKDTRGNRWAVLALLAIALALFAPVVAQPSGLIYPPRSNYTDLTITHWPNLAFAAETLRATGRLPLWRPTIMSGTPFAANPLAGIFYLPHIVLLVLPMSIGFNVLFIVHVWLTGCGAYALLCAWQVERWPAWIGALTWMATPKLFAHLGAGHLGMIEAVAWLPWAMLAVQRMVPSRRIRDGAWLGAVWAVQFLTDPRICFYVILLTSSYLIVSWLRAVRSRHWLSILLAVMTFAALSAMLWLPFVEFIRQSNRGALTLSEAGEFSLPLRHLVSLVLVDWGGLHEWAVYVGVLPLIAAIYAAYRVRRNPQSAIILWLLACLILAVLFSLGTNGPLFPMLFRILPGLSLLRVPPRAWFIVAFAVAMLTAFGIEAMMSQMNRPRAWLTLTGFALAVFCSLFGLGGAWILGHNPGSGAARASLLHLALVMPASIAIVLLRAHGRIGPREYAAGAAMVIVATLVPVDLGFYRVVPEAQAFADHADVAAWLAAQPGPFRVYSPSYSLPLHVAQRAGLELADGVDPMQIAGYVQWMQSATGAPASGYSVTLPPFPSEADVSQVLHDVQPDAHLLGELNVRYLASEFPINAPGLIARARLGPTFIYENTLALPRAFVTGGLPVRLVVLTPDHITVEADGPGVLTLSQVHYPGWRAGVDGRAAPVEVVDTVLMGVRLEAGQHRVEFVFDPWTVKAGLVISVAGWGIWLASLLIGWRRWNRVAG